MNKRAKRRAFGIFVLVAIMYVTVAFKLQDKIHPGRLASVGGDGPKAMTLVPSGQTAGGAAEAVSPAGRDERKTGHETSLLPSGEDGQNRSGELREKEGSARQAHPGSMALSKAAGSTSVLVSLPMVSFAMQQKWIDRDGLVSAVKVGCGSTSWKKPLDILRDKDIDGLRSLANTIGKKNLLLFLSKEGIPVPKDVSAEEILLGQGYRIEKEKLLELYGKYVTNEFDGLFPYADANTAIARSGRSFAYVTARRHRGVEQERPAQGWQVPNVTNLSIKAAVAELNRHTSNIKVFGNGVVADQQPKAFEWVRGEAECIIYGRTYR